MKKIRLTIFRLIPIIAALCLTACQTTPSAVESLTPSDSLSQAKTSNPTTPLMLTTLDNQSCHQWCHNGWCAKHCDDNYMP